MIKKEGWEKKTFNDVFSIITDGTHQTPTYTEDTVNGFKFLSSKDVVGGSINWSKIKYIPESLHNQLYARLAPQRNDILLAKNGTTGVCALVDTDDIFDIYVSLALLRPKIDFNVKYLVYFINSPSAKRQFNSHLKGVGVPNLHLSEIRKTKINIPPLPIQRQIVSELDALSDIITKKKQQLEELNKLAQATFYDMFGDPVSNEKGWEVKKLKDITTKINSGNTPKGGSNVYVQDGITFFRSQNVWKNNLVYDDIAFIDIQTHASMSKSSLKHKDILMTKTGRFNTENSSLGRAALFLGEDDTANINGHVYLIRLKKNQVHGFVLHILTCNAFRELIRNVCVGGIDKRQINKNHIEDFPIIYPSIESQQSFSKIMDSILIQKTLIDKSLIDVQQLFDYTMDKYFN